MSYRLVAKLSEKATAVGTLCRVLGVSRSGYYGSRQRALSAPKVCATSVQLKAEFAASGKVYGSRRLGAVLCSKGVRIGRYRVRRLMREHRLRALWRRKFIHTTDSGHAMPVSDNVLAREFDPGRPNQAWVSDITYIRTRSGRLPAHRLSLLKRNSRSETRPMNIHAMSDGDAVLVTCPQ